jgi:hypothetical protein
MCVCVCVGPFFFFYSSLFQHVLWIFHYSSLSMELFIVQIFLFCYRPFYSPYVIMKRMFRNKFKEDLDSI